MLGNSFLKADTAEEGLETWVFAKGIEGGFDGEFGHGERTLIEGLFEGIQSFGFLTKLDIENRGAKRRVVGFGWIDGELREFEELLPVTLRAAGGQGRGMPSSAARKREKIRAKRDLWKTRRHGARQCLGTYF